MKKPFFSIVLPTYNRADFITKAIESAMEQAFEDWELIIIDDGSTDDTKEVVQSYQEERIIYVWQENKERSAARNHGIEIARGQYVCFLDSDDYYLPNHLQDLYSQIEKHNYPRAVFMSGLECRDVDGKTLRKIDSLPELEALPNYILRNYCSINSQSLAVHLAIFEKHKFDVRFSLWEDTHLWTRVLNDFPLKPVNNYSVVLLVHENSGVVQGIQEVKIQAVLAYRTAIMDLVSGDNPIFSDRYELIKNYLDSKLRMYLYHARQNRQLFVALQIFTIAITNKPTLYLIRELVKIPLNFFGIGLNISLDLGHPVDPEQRIA